MGVPSIGVSGRSVGRRILKINTVDTLIKGGRWVIYKVKIDDSCEHNDAAAQPRCEMVMVLVIVSTPTWKPFIICVEMSSYRTLLCKLLETKQLEARVFEGYHRDPFPSIHQRALYQIIILIALNA